MMERLPMVTEAARQNPQTGKARTTGHVSGLTFVKVLMMERLQFTGNNAFLILPKEM